MKKTFKRIAALAFAGIMALALPIMAFAADGDVPTLDKDGTYHARLGVQTKSEEGSGKEWIQRIAYYEGGNQANDGEFLHSGNLGEEAYVKYDGTFNEVEITGNGVYTVTLTDGDFNGNITPSQIQVATDIPNTGEITFSDVTLKINGIEKGSMKTAYVDDDNYAKPYCCIVMVNEWRSSKNEEIKAITEGAVGVLKAEGTNSIEITFTVSGFNKDNPDAVAPTEAPTEAPATDAPAAATTAAAAAESSSSGLPTGAIIGIAVAVVAVIVVVVIVASSKKKNK